MNEAHKKVPRLFQELSGARVEDAFSGENRIVATPVTDQAEGTTSTVIIQPRATNPNIMIAPAAVQAEGTPLTDTRQLGVPTHPHDEAMQRVIPDDLSKLT